MKIGGFKHTYSLALRQPKFHLLLRKLRQYSYSYSYSCRVPEYKLPEFILRHFFSWEIRQYFRVQFNAKQSSIPKLEFLSVTYIGPRILDRVILATTILRPYYTNLKNCFKFGDSQGTNKFFHFKIIRFELKVLRFKINKKGI